MPNVRNTSKIKKNIKKTTKIKKRPAKNSSGLFNLFQKVDDGVNRPNPKHMDATFLLLIIIVVCVGLIMMLSASAPAANTKFGNSYHFFTKQLGYAIFGFFVMLFVSKIDYRQYKKYSRPFMIVCIILLVLVLIPGIGVRHNGARRWLKTGIEWQPSEFMKLAISIFYADMIENRKDDFTKIKKVTDFKMLLPYGIWLGLTALLLMCETHLSGTIIIAGIAIVILLVAGVNIKYFIGATIPTFGLGFLYLKTNAERWSRIMNFIDPFKDSQEVGYQVVQSLYAIATGGFFGLGLGQSVQKYSYLPEPYNDFIFAIVCEELGLFGAIAIMVLFAAIIMRGIKIAAEAPDKFGSLLVVGIMAQVAIQTILNIAVATSFIPNTGVALPFFSYGGTSLVVLMAEMGIVMNVSRYGRKGI